MIRRFIRLPSSAAAVRHLSTTTASVPEQPLVPAKGTKSGSKNETITQRLFGLVYSKRSPVVSIRKWKEQGHFLRKFDLSRTIRELRKLKRYKHALEICEWMQIQPDMQLVPGDYAIHLDLIAKIRGINSAEKFFMDLPERMRDASTCTALLHTYAQNKESEKAEALMEKMSECGFLKSPLPYNHMLTLYMSLGNLQKLSQMIQELKKNTSPDIITYNIWLSACASQNCVKTAEKVFLELNKSTIKPDWITYSTLASIYTKNSLQEKAESMVKLMEKRVTKKVRVAHASLISLHTALENKDGVWRIWKKMKSTYRKLNDMEYTSMITSLLKLRETEEAEKLYDEWESISPTKDSRVPNLLLRNYINNDRMEMAEAFYKRMLEKEIKLGYTTWELLTWGYLKQRQLEKALDCFNNAVTRVKSWDPDEKMVHAVCEAVEELGDVESAEKWLASLRDAGHVNTEIYKSLLRTYAKAGKMPLIVAERMKKDNLEIDMETEKLLQLTSKLCVGEIPSGVLNR